MATSGNKYRSRNLGLLARRFAPFREKAVVALEFGLEILAFGMKARAPQRTGRMAHSVRVTKVKNDHKRHRLYGRAYVAKPYAVYVNYGTRYMKAQPFVTHTQQIDGPLAVASMIEILRS